MEFRGKWCPFQRIFQGLFFLYYYYFMQQFISPVISFSAEKFSFSAVFSFYYLMQQSIIRCEMCFPRIGSEFFLFIYFFCVENSFT